MKQRAAEFGRRYRPARERRVVAALVSVLAVAGVSLSGLVAAGASAGSSGTTQAATCAEDPTGAGCTLTGLVVDASALSPCATNCEGVQMIVGVTANLPVDGIYSDGSEAPLTVLPGAPVPQVSLATDAQPTGVVEVDGVASGLTKGYEVQVTASAATTSPAVVQVGYDGFVTASSPLNAVVQAACGPGGSSPCVYIEGALVTISVELASGGSVTGTPLQGGVASITQAGAASATGAYTSDQPCYPEAVAASTTTATDDPATTTTDDAAATPADDPAATPADDPATTTTDDAATTTTRTDATTAAICQPAPAGDPAAASTTACTTGATGTCALTAMWDGTTEDFASPDSVVLTPPSGYAVTAVSGCSSQGGTAVSLVCDLEPADWSAPIAVTFDVVPDPVVNIALTGPAEPCNPEVCYPGEATVYDNDAVNGTTATITPTGGTPGSPVTCTVEDGQPGDDVNYGQEAFCSVSVPPGTYSVSLPKTIDTSQTSEVGIPLAFVTSADPQALTVVSGALADADFTSAYQPTINIELAGPLEPSCAPDTCWSFGKVYDNDAVDGTTATVTPVAPTTGTAQTCQLGGGYPGDNVNFGQEAFCGVGVPPGTYNVSLPAVLYTPDSEVGIPVAYVTGATTQEVTVGAGGSPEVSFTSAYEVASISVSLAGPLEPGCTAGTCAADDLMYDNDAVDGTTVTVSPLGATPPSGGASTPSGGANSPETCQVTGGIPGNASDGQAASCTVNVPPGTYLVSVPSRLQPDPDYGWGFVEVAAPATQTLAVSADVPGVVTFTSSYETMGNVGSGPGSARTSDGLVTAVGSGGTGSGGTGTVTVGEYSSDPEGPATFNSYSQSDDYFDVATSLDSTFTDLTFTVCGLNGNSATIFWWDASAADGNGQWGPLSPASAITSLKAGCLTAALTPTTSPSPTELTGTVFAIPTGLARQMVNFDSQAPDPALVGSAYRPVARSTSGLPVSVTAVGAATAGTAGVCSVSGAGPVSFTGPGTCVVEAYQRGDTHWAAAASYQNVVVSAGKPLAEDASYSTPYGKNLAVGAAAGVLARDTLNGAIIAAHTAPAHGTLVLRPNGSFLYAPRRHFSGTDSFAYTLKNASGRSTAIVTIRVRAEKRVGTQVRERRRPVPAGPHVARDT